MTYHVDSHDDAATDPAMARVPVDAATDGGGLDARGHSYPYGGDGRDPDGRWQEVLLRFVEDPRSAADGAHELTEAVLQQFTTAAQARLRELAAWRQDDGADTERLRTAVRQYRQLADQLRVP